MRAGLGYYTYTLGKPRERPFPGDLAHAWLGSYPYKIARLIELAILYPMIPSPSPEPTDKFPFRTHKLLDEP